MRRTMAGGARCSLAALVAMLAAAVGASPDPRAEFNLTEVAPGVFVHRGVHATADDPRHGDMANIGFIVGERCVAVIDTGGSVATGERLLAALRAHTDRPVCYVIDSHIHFDHLLGNAAFRDAHPQFVGHERLPEAVARNRAFFVEHFGADLAPYQGEEAIVGPDRVVRIGKPLELDLGGRVLELTAWPPAHTDTDLTVLDRNTGLLWAADLVFMERIPVLDGSLTGWLDALDTLQGQRFAGVVPGHGPARAAWPGAAADERRYLRCLLDQTRRAIAEGVFLEDAKGRICAGERAHWLLFDEMHGRNVSHAWKALEWE